MPIVNVLRSFPRSSVAGAVTHGDTVTITGSGFGSTIPTFSFLGGADGILENGTTNQTPADQSGWTFSRFNVFPKIGSDGTRGKCFINTLDGSSNFECCTSYDMGAGNTIAAGGKMYVSYMMRAAMDLASNGQDQFKIWRIGKADNISDDDTQIWQNYFDGTIQVHENPTGSSDTYYDGSYWSPSSSWKRVEIKLQASTQGGANGILEIRMGFDGVSVPAILQATSAGDSRELTQMRNYPDANRYRYFMLHLGIFNGPTNMVLATDDHYVQSGSLKRVECWSSLTPSSATRRELQKPTSWSDGSIDIKFNKGAFASGAAYLVVLDNQFTDTVLGSKAITIN